VWHRTVRDVPDVSGGADAAGCASRSVARGLRAPADRLRARCAIDQAAYSRAAGREWIDGRLYSLQRIGWRAAARLAVRGIRRTVRRRLCEAAPWRRRRGAVRGGSRQAATAAEAAPQYA